MHPIFFILLSSTQFEDESYRISTHTKNIEPKAAHLTRWLITDRPWIYLVHLYRWTGPHVDQNFTCTISIFHRFCRVLQYSASWFTSPTHLYPRGGNWGPLS